MYKLFNTGKQANVNYREYIVDTVEDIYTLPDDDPFGSIALIIGDNEEQGNFYIKSGDGEYHKVTINGEGGV